MWCPRPGVRPRSARSIEKPDSDGVAFARRMDADDPYVVHGPTAEATPANPAVRLASTQAHARAWALDAMVEADDARGAKDGRGGADVVMVVLDDLGLLTEDQPKSAPDVADVQGLVIRVQKQYSAIHRSLKPAGTRPDHVCIVAKVALRAGVGPILAGLTVRAGTIGCRAIGCQPGSNTS